MSAPVRASHICVMADPKKPSPPPAQPVRDAGPDAMKSPPEDWDEIDEAEDESFPASDPQTHSPPKK